MSDYISNSKMDQRIKENSLVTEYKLKHINNSSSVLVIK